MTRMKMAAKAAWAAYTARPWAMIADAVIVAIIATATAFAWFCL